MAERIVSPGVFTRERDLSFLPQGISEIGAAIIGPTVKGPAFVPSIVRNFADFEEVFGSTDTRYYTPYAVEQYLRSAGTVTIVRILGLGGYTADFVNITQDPAARVASLEITVGAVPSNTETISITFGDGATPQVITFTSGVGTDGVAFSGNAAVLYLANNTNILETVEAIAILAGSVTGFSGSFSPTVALVSADTAVATTYNLAATEAATNVTIGPGITSGLADVDAKILAVLAPSRGGSAGTADLSGCTITGTWGASTLILSGSDWGVKNLTSRTYAISFDTGSGDYIESVFSPEAQIQKSGQNTVAAYLYKNFKHAQSSQGYTLSNSAAVSSSLSSGSLSLATDYANASTPSIQSQLINGSRYSLFKVNTRSHGADVNDKYKIEISMVQPAGSIAGSDYGSFSLRVLQTGFDDNFATRDNPAEEWSNLNFDPTSPNFFARVIGDRYVTISSAGKLTYNGDWPNRSKHIYVSDYSDIQDGSSPKVVVPMGHAAISNPIPGNLVAVPVWAFKTAQTNTQDQYNSNVSYGHDYANADAGQYLAPINAFGVGSQVSMSLEDMYGHDDTLLDNGANGSTYLSLSNSHKKQRNFVVPFQGGFDGDNPAVSKNTGIDILNTNVMGFDCSTASTNGTLAYQRAINAVSNPDEFDINMMVTPGIIHGVHSKITNHAIAKCEARGDCFYIVDSSKKGDSIATSTGAVSTLDTNYTATYYPWVKIVDRATSLPVWVPPSCVLPGVIAYTDKVAHEWFAPAGLNRGGLTTVLEAETRLTHAERDDLYEERVNPIASFPAQGVVVWGQKTLQARPSALDRVNVRRLLIRLKKFIASASRYLVFEQNTSATRNRFLNIVNPFLESVQANSGLSAFKVVMDDSNNPPDVIDRNQLVGQIFIQPTRTAEFIVLDFVVLPTGATFPE
jgi:hypothetical protein